MLVNPNNPTGSFVRPDDLRRVQTLCRECQLALIVDEVFGFYPIAPDTRGPSVLDQSLEVLTFVLGGLSKAVGLPGLKLGWIVVGGPESSASEALRRLEVINDTYLSVATPVQVAADELLRCGVDVTEQIARRVRGNYRSLGRLVSEYPAARLLPVEGGWYAVVQVPATEPEETLALELLEREHVLVHPGYYFDFPREAYLILSLLPEPAVLEPAARRILAHSAGRPSSDS